MLTKLKTLKQRIDKNIIELQKIHPYSQNISEALSILIKQNASDTMIRLWMRGSLELVTNIEDVLVYIEQNEKPHFKNKVILLKEKIDKNITHLEVKYPLARTISESIDTLLEIEAPESLIRPWLNSIDSIISAIEKELELMGKD